MLDVGTLLHNRYRIVDVLGKGGMGAVYMADDESLNVRVAVKENLIDDEEASRQFRREAEILARLRHPNLPRVTDHFVIAGQGQYLVMDFVEGEDLRQRLDRSGPVDQKEVIKMGATLCDALTYLHSQDPPILHRDIKPGNIKITPSGAVFLVDFGLAKIMMGSQQTTTGARGLTPGYSPPEQYGSARTDARSDVYSLGATLYAALTGVQPEDGLSIMIDQAKLTPVSERNKDVSKQLEDAIHDALDAKMEERIQSAAEFKGNLLSASDTVQRQVGRGDFAITPAPGTIKLNMETKKAGEDEETVTQRARPYVFGGIITVVLLLAGIGAAAVFAPDLLSGFTGGSTPTFSAVPPTATVIEVSAEETATETIAPTETTAPTETSLPTDTPTPAPTPMGGSAEIVFASMRDGRPQLFLLNVLTFEIEKLTDVAGGACQPSWAPDGMRLVFISPCRTSMESYDASSLFILNLEDGSIEEVPNSQTGDYDPAWSPLGDMIAFTSLRFGNHPNVHTVDLASGFVRNLSNSAVSDYHPAWSPDGQWLMFTTTGLGGSRLFFMDAATGTDRRAFSRSDTYVNTEPFWSVDGQTVFFTQFSGGSSNQRLLKAAPWEDGGPATGYNEYLVIDTTRSISDAGFSPDGTWMVYVTTQDPGNFDLFIMLGRDIRRMTTDAGLDFDPVWRPFVTNP